MLIWFATGNTHKKEELASILRDALQKSPKNSIADTEKPPFELKIPREAGLDFEPEETGNSFLENALIKAEKLHSLLENSAKQLFGNCGGPVIAEDSGICVDALDGRPGILSARYGGKDLGAAEKNALLLDEIGDKPLRSARFICAMVLYYGPGRFYVAQECLEGELVKSKEAIRGKGGFGYDPILYIPELGRTVAELSAEEKNRLSHRGKAGRVIAKVLQELFS